MERPAQETSAGQILDPRFYQNFFHSAFGCGTSRSQDEPDTARRSDIGSQIIRFLGFPEEPIRVDLGEMAQQVLAKVQDTGNDAQPPERKIPSWEQDPAPLQGWSKTDQRLFIIAVKEAKLKSSMEASRLRRKLDRISVKFPGKSLGDCEKCFRHVEKSRIAYFGPKDE